MNRRSLALRLEALERQMQQGGTDLAAEAALYGRLIWGGAAGSRCYLGGGDNCLRLAVVGGLQDPLVYEVVGVPMGALT